MNEQFFLAFFTASMVPSKVSQSSAKSSQNFFRMLSSVNPAWCAQWQGKSILTADKKLFGIEVKKGKVDPSIAVEKAHKVDGLSGATITCNGITRFVKSDLKALDSYLAPLRK